MSEPTGRLPTIALTISALITLFPPWNVTVYDRSPDWAVPTNYYVGHAFLFSGTGMEPVFYNQLVSTRFHTGSYIAGSHTIAVRRLCCQLAFVWFAAFSLTAACRRVARLVREVNGEVLRDQEKILPRPGSQRDDNDVTERT